MTAEFGSSAYLNMMHDLNLFILQRVGLPVIVPVKVEDISHFPLFPVIKGVRVHFIHCRPPLLQKAYQEGF
jgi:hypothetical protein